jgi:NAD(P)-dependent dehydrogenase (short-subunit alcohol dehydrogenase family)
VHWERGNNAAIDAAAHSRRAAGAALLRRRGDLDGAWVLPDDLAGVAVFLASPTFDFITGAVIPVDAGFSTMG